MSRITTITFTFAIPRTSIELRENFRGQKTTEEETNQRATGLAPPAYLTPWPPLLPYSVVKSSTPS